MEINENRQGYKKTKVGWIPDDWQFKSIGTEIDLLSGFPFSSFEYAESGTRLLRGANIKRGNTDWSESITRYWNSKILDYTNYLLEAGDLVIAMDGSLVGRSYAVINDSDLPALLLQRVARIRGITINTYYLSKIIGSPIFIDYCDKVKTVTAIPHISAKDIKEFKIPLPPLPEQQRIAEILSTWDEAIQKLDALIVKKQELKKGLMQQLLTGQLRFPEFVPKGGTKFKDTKLGLVPEDWEVMKMQNIAKFINGRAYKQDELLSKGKYQVLRVGNLFTNNSWYYSDLELEKDKYIDQGDLIYAWSASFGPRFWEGKKAIYHYHIWKVNVNSNCHKNYLYYYLHFDALTISNNTQGGTMAHVTKSIMESRYCVIPSMKEQERISEALSNSDFQIERYSRMLKLITDQKEGLMQQLLTGAVRTMANN